ncbi:MAG: M15 family metallopeptidase [Candidatus Saccharimonadales bacterium]
MNLRLKYLLIFITVLLITALLYLFVFHPTSSAPKSTATTQGTPQLADGNAIAEEPPVFDTTTYSVDDPASIWIVTNKQRPLSPKTYAPNDLVPVGSGQQLRKEAAAALQQLIAAASTEGLSIKPLSGYRSYDKQVSVYGSEVNAYGQAVADTQSARPGYSEHQTGLAIDVGGGGCGIEDCFGDTAEGKWIAANSYKHGFIVRYIPGKETVTGYRAEPWHIRYIGVDLAAEMHKQGISTLEEFFKLPPAPSY